MNSTTWTPTPAWLEVRVIDGMQLLLTLRLRNAPPVDTVEAMVKVWAAAFMATGKDWQEARDGLRIGRAFLAVAAKADTWPAPAQVLAALPPVPDAPRLPPPDAVPIPADVRRRLAELTESMRLKSDPPDIRKRQAEAAEFMRLKSSSSST